VISVGFRFGSRCDRLSDFFFRKSLYRKDSFVKETRQCVFSVCTGKHSLCMRAVVWCFLFLLWDLQLRNYTVVMSRSHDNSQTFLETGRTPIGALLQYKTALLQQRSDNSSTLQIGAHLIRHEIFCIVVTGSVLDISWWNFVLDVCSLQFNL